MTYYKPASSPQLLAKRFTNREDRFVVMTRSDFLVRAWKLANDKARELGWIELGGLDSRRPLFELVLADDG